MRALRKPTHASACLFSSVLAGEVVHPRKTLPKAFTTIIYRLAAFFCLGALAVGICVPYTDPGLGGATNAVSSPYVLSMERLNIPIVGSLLQACACFGSH